MLPYNHPVYAELTTLLKTCVADKLPVYNATMLSKVPKHPERIEFKLINFFSTGQIYPNKTIGTTTYKVGTIAEYRCQLSIRIFEDPKNCGLITNRITGAIQTFAYLEQFVEELYIENETMKVKPFSLEKDGEIKMFNEILVDCYLGVDFEGDIDWFDKLQDVVVDFNSDGEVIIPEIGVSTRTKRIK